MNNFEFHNPVKILFGQNQIEKIVPLMMPYQKIMITYGMGSVKKNGILDTALSLLKDKKIVEFGGIEANPQYDTLMKAVKICKEEKVDFILAIGGGSVVDGTKFIAAALHVNFEPWDILQKNARIEKALPFGAVLTLAATGSEMNCFAVVSRGENKLSFGNPLVFPQFSVLDPTYTFTLNERQLGNGLVDSFVHVCEQYLTSNINTPVQDRMACALLRTIVEEAPKVIELKDDYDARANYMWSATLALNGMIGVGTEQDWSTHLIGHELTALYGIDHARSLALVLPSMLRFQKEHKSAKLFQMAQEVFNIRTPDFNQTIMAGIDAIEDFFNSVGVPTKLRVYNLNADDVEKVVAKCQEHYPFKLSEKRNLESKHIRQILTMAL